MQHCIAELCSSFPLVIWKLFHVQNIGAYTLTHTCTLAHMHTRKRQRIKEMSQNKSWAMFMFKMKIPPDVFTVAKGCSSWHVFRHGLWINHLNSKIWDHSRPLQQNWLPIHLLCPHRLLLLLNQIKTILIYLKRALKAQEYTY